MSKISEMILFHSRHSPHSRDVVSIIKKYSVPVRVLSVDNQQMRGIIENSERFRIKGVPTLLVNTGEKLSIFEGEKAYRWLLTLVQGEEEEEQKHQEEEHQTSEIIFDESQEQRDEGISVNDLKITNETVKQAAARMQREAKEASGMDI